MVVSAPAEWGTRWSPGGVSPRPMWDEGTSDSWQPFATPPFPGLNLTLRVSSKGRKYYLKLMVFCPEAGCWPSRQSACRSRFHTYTGQMICVPHSASHALTLAAFCPQEQWGHLRASAPLSSLSLLPRRLFTWWSHCRPSLRRPFSMAAFPGHPV